MRRAGARLGDVLHAQHCLALRHRVAGLADGGQPRVELVGGNRLAETGVGLVDSVPDAVDLLACECAGGDDGRIADEGHAILDALADLGFRLGAFHEVPLIQHDDVAAHRLRPQACAAGLVGQAGQAVTRLARRRRGRWRASRGRSRSTHPRRPAFAGAGPLCRRCARCRRG